MGAADLCGPHVEPGSLSPLVELSDTTMGRVHADSAEVSSD